MAFKNEIFKAQNILKQAIPEWQIKRSVGKRYAPPWSALSVGIQMRLPRDEGIVNVDIPSLTLYVFKSCYLSREHPDTAKNL
jgi:hypothetical protein